VHVCMWQHYSVTRFSLAQCLKVAQGTTAQVVQLHGSPELARQPHRRSFSFSTLHATTTHGISLLIWSAQPSSTARALSYDNAWSVSAALIEPQGCHVSLLLSLGLGAYSMPPCGSIPMQPPPPHTPCVCVCVHSSARTRPRCPAALIPSSQLVPHPRHSTAFL